MISKRMGEKSKSKHQGGFNILEMDQSPEKSGALARSYPFGYCAGTSRWEVGYVEFSIDSDEKDIGFVLMELAICGKHILP